MPHFKPPKSFPGTEALPEGLQRVLSTLFPPDDLGPAMPQTVVAGPSKALLEALRPLPASLKKGTEIATDVMRSKDEWMPEHFPITAHPTVQEMFLMLRKPEGTIDPLKVLAGERINSRPPKFGGVQPPEGFYFGKSLRNQAPTIREARAMTMKRDPLVEEMTARYRKFDNVQKDARRHSRGGSKPKD